MVEGVRVSVPNWEHVNTNPNTNPNWEHVNL